MVPDAWLGIWTKPAPPHHTLAPRSAFEPVLFRGQRPRPPDAAHAIDWTHAAPLRDYPGQVVGTKPPEFSWWVFDCLCADPEVDTLDDLYPGSGAVRRAWDRYRPRRAPVPSEGGRIIAGSETGKEQAA